jgi:sRNA-binding carbon storage regulator CsrA
MLSVQMHEGEFMTIGDNIQIHCTRASMGGLVTLGIDAPREIQVRRAKHVERDLKALADAGDPDAWAALQKLNEARQVREDKLEKRKAVALKRKQERQAV